MHIIPAFDRSETARPSVATSRQLPIAADVVPICSAAKKCQERRKARNPHGKKCRRDKDASDCLHSRSKPRGSCPAAAAAKSDRCRLARSEQQEPFQERVSHSGCLSGACITTRSRAGERASHRLARRVPCDRLVCVCVSVGVACASLSHGIRMTEKGRIGDGGRRRGGL